MERQGDIAISPRNRAEAAHGLNEPRRERVLHVFWAALSGLLMAAILLFEPIDWMVWTNQTRLSGARHSGEIVYVQVPESATLKRDNIARRDLAHVLDQLQREGVPSVFIDLRLQRSTSAEADRSLVKALRSWGDRVTFVNLIDVSLDGQGQEQRSDRYFTDGHGLAWQGISNDWPNAVWSLPYSYRTSAGVRPSFPAALAGIGDARHGSFPVHYAVRKNSAPAFDATALLRADGASARSLAGRTVVIGTQRKTNDGSYRVPVWTASAPSYVAINGAETLKGRPVVFVSGLVAVLCLAAFFGLSAAIRSPMRRRVAYVASAALIPYLLVLSGPAGLRVELSYTLPFLVVFAIFRSRSSWRLRLALVDQDTGLPSLRALRRSLADPINSSGYTVVAKIHGYETIQHSLEPHLRTAYVLKLVERLRVGNAPLQIFFEGHHLAWLSNHTDSDKLREHLEGLRALFAAPVQLGEHRIDVGITFGAAPSNSGAEGRGLVVALAAVEETNEALEPIRIASLGGEDDALWDLSLRARIDAAMEAGEVFCVYQPKMDIAADRMIGVEALVRWEDPTKGSIAPMHFVMQCEKAGRMEYLTRYVLQSACTAGALLHFRGNRITMAVNISATLLSDMRIVGIVRNVLQATGFDPHFLVLEITETARIRDLAEARGVLNALKALGTQLSMDDFGSGAANFETLQALPFDELKIDRQFIANAASSPKARAIAESLVSLGSRARIAVVAEGAETPADLQMLREIGCSQVQGYALARPMPLANLLNLLGESDHAQAQADF